MNFDSISKPYAGLSHEEAQAKLTAGLGNTPVRAKSRSFKRIVIDNCFTFFNFINVLLATLVIAACFYDISYLKNLLFLIVVVLNSGIGVIQEWQAKRTIDRLMILTEASAKVRRSGELMDIPVSELVPGDLLVIEAGRQLSVDGRLLSVHALELDESLLTGESDAILKQVGDEVFSGSIVMAGDAEVFVEKVSKDTLAARITAEATEEVRPSSSLFRSLNRIIKIVSLLILPISGLLIAKQYFFQSGDLASKMVRTVSVLLSMLPEGLILLASMAFAVSVIKLGQKRCLVQTMPSIETLARVDTLCLDKTGTITTGQMQVAGFAVPGEEGRWNLHSPREAKSDLLLAAQGALSVENQSAQISETPLTEDLHQLLAALSIVFPDGNATQQALANVCPISPPAQALANQVTELYPFSSERKWSGAQFGDKGIWITGAADRLLAGRSPQVLAQVEALAHLGLRVLALVQLKEAPYRDEKQKLHLPEAQEAIQLRALLLIEDELRHDAQSTFQAFSDQGVTLKIISGDHPHTVRAIAERAGLGNLGKLVDLSQYPDDAQFDELVDDYQLFGRVSPFQKRGLLQALKRKGHTVAMTGDGVNDVLALKDADCGVAMASGSDAAKAAADLVLLDNQMTCMVDAFYEGRRVVNNIQRVSSLFLIKTTYATVFALLMLILPIAYPLFPIQASLISAATVGIPSFFLALRANRERIEGSFLANVLPSALPPGLTAALFMLAYQFVGFATGSPHTLTGTLSLFTLIAIGLQTLYRLSKPFDAFKAGLFALCALIPAVAIGVLPRFFMIHWPVGRDWAYFIPLTLLALLMNFGLHKVLQWKSVRMLFQQKLGPSKQDLQEERAAQSGR